MSNTTSFTLDITSQEEQDDRTMIGVGDQHPSNHYEVLMKYGVPQDKLEYVLLGVQTDDDLYEFLSEANTHGVDEAISRIDPDNYVPYCYRVKSMERYVIYLSPAYIKIEMNVDKIEGTLTHGVYKCFNPRCESTAISVRTKQTRRADEPETTTFTCTVCGKRWTI